MKLIKHSEIDDLYVCYLNTEDILNIFQNIEKYHADIKAVFKHYIKSNYPKIFDLYKIEYLYKTGDKYIHLGFSNYPHFTHVVALTTFYGFYAVFYNDLDKITKISKLDKLYE